MGLSNKAWDECIGCANCCKYLAEGPYFKKDTSTIEFYKVRAEFSVQNIHGQYWFFIYSPCPQLEDGLCKIYETRPATCRKFPKPTHVRGILKHICKRIRTLYKAAPISSYKPTLKF